MTTINPAPKKDTRTIFGSSQTDPNKILPMKYLWARKYYKDGIANNWVPEEISMQSDVGQWKSATFLSSAERKLILWNLGFFSTAESLTANNLVLAVYRHVTNPECRQYLLRQAFEEAVHTDTFIYCCDSLGLDPDEIYNMYLTIPSIEEKDNFVIELTKSIFDPKFEIKNDGIYNSYSKLIKNLNNKYIFLNKKFLKSYSQWWGGTVSKQNWSDWDSPRTLFKSKTILSQLIN